jgi:hypothetical protein
VRELAREFGLTAHIRSRGEEKKALAREAGFRGRRWVVERTHSWLNRYRAILIRWSKKPENHLALLHLACRLSPGEQRSPNLYRDRLLARFSGFRLPASGFRFPAYGQSNAFFTATRRSLMGAYRAPAMNLRPLFPRA